MTYFTTGAQLQAALNALPNTKTGNFVAFDSFFYGQQYMADYQGTLSPIEHFVQIGAARGYKPNATFDPTYYKNAFADLKNTDFNAADLLYHFMQYGLDEGRIPSEALATFDGTAYLAANPDVAAYVNANLAQFGGSVTNGALAHYVKFGAAEGRTAPGTSVSNGQTFTLTTGIDNFKGAAGDDTFIGGNGAANTTGPADQLDGGAGVDTFKFYGGAVTNQMPTLKNIEKLFLSASNGTVNAAGIAGVESVEVNAAAGAHTVALAAAQALTLSDITAAAGTVPTTVTGSAAAGITLNNVIDKSVTPNGAQTLNVNTRDAALKLNATGSASSITLLSNSATAAADMAALTKLTVTGDAKLTVAGNASYTNLTTVDASANTAGVDFRQGFDTNLTFTGGAGADRVLVAGAITAQDKLDGGAGSDTLAIANGGLTANAVANVKNFEVLEVRGGITQDASVFAAQNTLTGLTVTNTGTAQTFSVTNLAATAKDGIIVNHGATAVPAPVDTTLTVGVKDFVAGGTSDSATVTVNAHSSSATATPSVLNLTFDNVDVLNLVSKGTLATNVNTINLTATDAEKIVLTGNIATTLAPSAASVGITEVDASGLVVANGLANGMTFAQAIGATQSLLVTGSNGIDTVTVESARGTVVANGGNDVITFSTAAAALGDQSVNLSAKDFVAGGALNVTVQAGSAGFAVINFSSDIENTLKIGGVNLGTTTANQNVGAAINGQNNVAIVGGALQFDVNGDGVFNAADDLSITLTGVNTTITYNAANDYFVLTA